MSVLKEAVRDSVSVGAGGGRINGKCRVIQHPVHLLGKLRKIVLQSVQSVLLGEWT